MAVNEGWGRRLRAAKRAWEEAHDAKMTYKDLGARVAKLAGQPKAFAHTTARAWFLGMEPDTFAVTEAIAAVLEVEPGALVFGRDGHRRFDDLIAEARKLSEDEIARARKKRVAEPASEKPEKRTRPGSR